MTGRCLETYDGGGTGAAAKRRTDARDEYAFLVAAKSGDSAAFEFLCKQSANMIFRVARRMMRNNEDAEDVLQESFQQAFIHLNRFNGDSRFSTWLSRIAINAALMKLRKKQHLADVSLDEPPETEQWSSHLEVQDQGLNPEQLYAQRERQRILSTAMKELTPGTRKAIELRELDERSSEETAQIMGISVGAVKTRLFHGRRKLRERLKHFVGPARGSGANSARHRRHVVPGQVACSACDQSGGKTGPW
jgi:RNA polymerase sigma-70 factor, ECF subfamily